MRIIFLGSGEFGLPTLKRLHGRHEVVAVVTQPDRPSGRRRAPTPTPIAQFAESVGIDVLRCADVNEADFVRRVGLLGADFAVVIAFGQKLGPHLVEALGPQTVNLHGSLLPKYRGAAPINWAMIQGETHTGLTVISIAQKIDGGLIYAQARTNIDPLETAGQLHDRLAAMGPELVEQVLEKLCAGALDGRPQDETLTTRAPKLTKADGWVDFGRSALDVRCRVHGLTPWPGVSVSWFSPSTGRRRPLAIRRVVDLGGDPTGHPPGTVLPDHLVAVGDGAIRVLEVQAPGRRAMAFEQFVQGQPLAPRDKFE